MKEKPLVTICIPHYNNKDTISQTLDSLLSQNYKNILIKIFDNASDQESFAILKMYEKKNSNILLFRNEINIGGEANFTKCIENLEGNYGAIYHADDVYSPDMVLQQVEFLEKYKECSGVATHAYTIDENSKKNGYRPIPKKYLKNNFNIIGNQLELFKAILENGNFITCPSVMARTEVYKEKIRFWNGTDFKTSADLDVWMRIALQGKFALISSPLILYRESSISYTYNEIRTRTTDNNMFLVLDYYLRKYEKSLTSLDISRYDFLLFKDNVNRTINEVIKGKHGDLTLNIFQPSIIQIALSSKQNFKIYLTGIIFKILRNFTLSKKLQDKIFQYRFKGKRD